MRGIYIDLRRDEVNADRPMTWNNVFNLGTGFTSITDDFRTYIVEAQRDIGFKFVRIKDIFYSVHSFYYILNARLVYNWNLVNEVLDLFVDLGVSPIFEIGYGDYIKEFEKLDGYENIYEFYRGVISDFLNHVLNRYGVEVVSSWGVETLLFPSDIMDFEKYSQENREIYRAVYSVLVDDFKGNILMGTGFLSLDGHIDLDTLEEFLLDLRNDFPRLDFFIVHLYLNNRFVDLTMEEYNRKVYLQAKKSCALINELMLKYFPKILLGVTESLKSVDYRNDYYDYCVGAALLADSFIYFSDSQVVCISNWTLRDRIRSLEDSNKPFYGGHGIYTKDGIKKPIYHVCSFISRLGSNIIDSGEDYMVSREDSEIRILLVNDGFLSDESLEILDQESFVDFYRSYRSLRSFEINLAGLDGDYKITSQTLSRDYGSAFDIWTRSGFGNLLTFDEIDYLKSISRPKMSVEYIAGDGSLSFTRDLEAFSIELIRVEQSI